MRRAKKRRSARTASTCACPPPEKPAAERSPQKTKSARRRDIGRNPLQKHSTKNKNITKKLAQAVAVPQGTRPQAARLAAHPARYRPRNRPKRRSTERVRAPAWPARASAQPVLC